MEKCLILVFIFGVLTGCGGSSNSGSNGGTNTGLNTGPNSGAPAPVGVSDPSGVVVKSRALVTISSGAPGSNLAMNDMSVDFDQPISVTDASSTSMVVDNSCFKIPNISSQMLDFGTLAITSLSDNNLDVCGANGTTACGTALIRIYTTGTAGAGLYNSAGGYGLPITIGNSATPIGLNVAGAVTMQSISIPSTKHVIHLSDFTGTKYDVKIDFSNAGAGSYSTTLVIEYALTQ